MESSETKRKAFFDHGSVERMHRWAVLFLAVWAVGSAVYLGLVASRAPTELIALQYVESQSPEARAEAISEWRNAFPLTPFEPLVARYEGFHFPDQTPEQLIKVLNNEAKTTFDVFWDCVYFLLFLYALSLVLAAIAWRGPSIGCALGILLIGLAGIPNFAENFVGLHNEQLLFWILPIFIPGLVCLATGICDGLFHPDSQQSNDWRWFWGGTVLTAAGVAFIASLFLMEGSGRVSSKGALALPFGLYLMAIHGSRLFKRKSGKTDDEHA